MKTTKQLTLKQLTPIQSQVNDLVITDEPTLKTATEYLSQANILLKNITTDKKKITDPLNESLKAIRLKYKPMEDTLSDIIDAIRGKMTVYATLQAKTEQSIADKVESGYILPETALKKLEALPSTEVTTESGSIQFRNIPELVIEDTALIPREYLIPDEKKIKDALKAGLAVPGAKMVDRQVPFNKR